MRFPTEFIERLRDQLPLSAVIGKRIALRKHGKEYHALCPFHKEKSPSFTVNDDKGFYHCFGCGAHGDAIGFIREYEGVNYPEAVERLASEAGMPVPQMSREAEEYERKRHTLEDVVAYAAHWFREQLKTGAGKEARDYLASRELQSDMIEKFGLGFAPNSRDALKSALAKQGIQENLMVEAGLLARTDENVLYDRFRGRLMFPIKSPQGKIIAFGGRILPSAQTPNAAKYLNSSETPLFKKGETLFGYDLARQAAREKNMLVLVEGYMDVIAMHKAGFPYAVAPLGTAVTEQQLKLMWRTVPEPVLCLDGDEAGKRAMMRAAEIALPHVKANTGLKFAMLPKGEDPDSLARTRGVSALQTVLDNARPLSETLWETSRARFGFETAEKRAMLEHHLTETANAITDAAFKKHLQRYFDGELYALSRASNQRARKPELQITLGSLPDSEADDIHIKTIENQIVAIILLHPGLLQSADMEEKFVHLDLTQSELDKLRAHILEIHADSGSLDSDALCAALAARGFGEKVNTLLHSEKSVLSKTFTSRILADGAIAARAFEDSFFAYTLKKVEQDRHIAASQMEKEMTESNYSRFIALDQQWEALRRSRYSVTHDEQFS